MKKFSIKDLAKIIRAHAIRNTQACPERSRRDAIRDFTGVSTDSRTTKAGDCFFAIAGDNFNGADFLADVFAKGAACAVVNTQYAIRKPVLSEVEGTQYEILKVNDTIKALGDFAREYRRQGSFKVVAITGSAGKTTTRQIAYHVLSQHYRVFAAPKNFNNNIGLPLTLLGADPEDKIIIAEIGSNSPGEIAYLTRIAQPNIAVVTNVYLAHLAGFGNLQTIIQEKLSISEGLQDGGDFVINADLVKWLNGNRLNYQSGFPQGGGPPITNHHIITFGKSNGCDIQAQNVTHNSFASSFTIDGTQVCLPLPGLGNVENAVAAWSICSRFGININDFARAVKTLPTIPMRTELLQIGTLTVLNDCYNANPASMKNALDILVNLGSARNGRPAAPTRVGRHGGRLVFICGDMAELGQQAELLHAELGASIAQAKVQLLLAVGKFAKIAAQTAKRIAEYDLQTKCFEDTLSACNNLKKFIEDSDIVLVKGSRVARLEMAIEKLKELFS